MDLRMRVRTQGEVTIVEVGGEIDLHSAPQLRAELLKAAETVKPRVVIDLSEVTFIDSTGIGVLVGALKRAREKGGALNFCGIQSRVKRVFEITGLMRALPLFDSRELALKDFGEHGDD
jgi:anti-sigma B factor antagonist